MRHSNSLIEESRLSIHQKRLLVSLSMNLIIAGRYREALEAAQNATARTFGDGWTLAWVETMRGLGLMGAWKRRVGRSGRGYPWQKRPTTTGASSLPTTI